VLIAIGSTDILFALDSIPAAFGVTDEAYIVFVANALALLGLRALFFLVKGLLDRLAYLSTGLAIILAFIGVKLVPHWAHGLSDAVPEISTNLSLLVLVVVLTITTVASLIKVRRDPTARGHPGSVRDHRTDPDDQAESRWAAGRVRGCRAPAPGARPPGPRPGGTPQRPPGLREDPDARPGAGDYRRQV
jgi:tellurite resistance protein TerC